MKGRADRNKWIYKLTPDEEEKIKTQNLKKKKILNDIFVGTSAKENQKFVGEKIREHNRI